MLVLMFINIAMKVLITGDSWGRGEWGHDKNGKYDNLHPGLQQYLEQDGHAVTNVSMPCGHNQDACRNMKLELSKSYDMILWLKADPLRDLIPEDYDPIKHDFTSYDELLSESKRLTKLAYQAFDSCGVKINCLGGGGKLDLKMMSEHDNLIPLIPSITELVLQDYEHPELWASDWIFLIDKRFDLASIDKLLDNKRRQDSLSKNNSYKKFFWPDGDHPNRHGWRVVYDHIKPRLGL